MFFLGAVLVFLAAVILGTHMPWAMGTYRLWALGTHILWDLGTHILWALGILILWALESNILWNLGTNMLLFWALGPGHRAPGPSWPLKRSASLGGSFCRI